VAGPEGAVFGAGIGAIAGGLAGYFVGSAYGRWRLRHRDDD
jgi:membrane protein DedA with SNARE-associated domain